MRRKSRSPGLDVRAFSYRTGLRPHTWRPEAARRAEAAAAAAISGGDFRCFAPTKSAFPVVYYFKTAAQAHAMGIWFEAEGHAYDRWDEMLRSWEATLKAERSQALLINGLAATGTMDRVLAVAYARGLLAANELLRALEPWLDQMSGAMAVQVLIDADRARRAAPRQEKERLEEQAALELDAERWERERHVA